MAEPITTIKSKAHVRKGRYEQYVLESLASKGNKLIYVNWKKRTIHYLNEKGQKKVSGFYGL